MRRACIHIEGTYLGFYGHTAYKNSFSCLQTIFNRLFSSLIHSINQFFKLIIFLITIIQLTGILINWFVDYNKLKDEVSTRKAFLILNFNRIYNLNFENDTNIIE